MHNQLASLQRLGADVGLEFRLLTSRQVTLLWGASFSWWNLGNITKNLKETQSIETPLYLQNQVRFQLYCKTVIYAVYMVC